MGLRREARGYLVVDVGHRMDCRSQLHRVRPSTLRVDDGSLRRSPRPPWTGDLLSDNRGEWRNGRIHRSHRCETLARYGSEVAKRFDLRTVQRVFSAGEVLNPP